ncbi:hypothetical protein [Allorhizocola rhizosphaerae]|uniref:hypothetical protein n=1 Tax=Allorhizocola rhizosphaerae TaxID=1872709 RepID=UPI0013C2D19D|nr:hypothetical protein [Allorhizocola rhizosphaerae]
MITSYDPRLTLVGGPFSLGRAMALRLAEALADQDSLTPTAVADRMEPFVRHPLRDAFIQCGSRLVPALQFGVGIPDTTVIVSADLLSHPIALGLWQWSVETPILDRVSFE